jgi:hypothetical protein
MRPIQAVKDDLLPLSVPLETATGELVDTVFVRKGQWAKLPIECISRSEALWGPDAKVFNPARWLEEGRGVGKYRARAPGVLPLAHVFRWAAHLSWKSMSCRVVSLWMPRCSVRYLTSFRRCLH